MPINRYQIRNVYSLADQELYKAADKDDPEALLEGVAMAGLVGVLRQLGDLAEFAAEIFHELHEEVTATAARGHGLLVHAQQLELEIPSIQRSFMSQTCHSTFFTNSGVDWHPNLQTKPNLITTGELPRFVMNSYEECRGPPRLFLLDKFDVGGAGACLKRYTDPSFYKVEVSSYEIENAEIQRDKKIRKNKKKGSQWKLGGTPEISPNSKAKLHQLFMEDRMQIGTVEPTHRVKLKKRPNKSPFDSETYMNKLLKSPSEGKIVHPVPFHPSIIPVPFDSPNQSGFEIFKDTIGSPFNLATPSRSPSVSSSVENTGCRNPADNLAGKVTDRKISDLTNSGSPKVNEEIKTDGVQNGYRSDDVASEMENYVDAPATMESGPQFQFSDSQLTGSTEILFHPRVPLEKIPGISYGECIDVNQGVVLEEESEEDENLKSEENLVDFHSPAGSLLSFQFFGNFEGEVENEHPNDGSSPMIHPPNILETSDKINEDNHSTEDDSVSVVEETLDSCEKCSLPEEKLNEIGDGDDVLHIFDSAEAKVSSFSEDEKGSNRSEIETVTRAVSDLDDAVKSGELKERETGLVNSESTPVPAPDDVDRNDDKALSTLEDDTKSEGREEDSVDPKMEKSVVVLLPLDVNTNENNAHDASLASSHDLSDEVDGNDNNALSTLEDDTPLEGKGEEDSVDMEEMKKSAPDLDDDDVDRNDDNALSTHKDDNPSFLQDQTRSFLGERETNENGEKAVVLLHDFGSQPMTVTEKPPMLELPPPEMEDKEDPQLLFASAGSRFSSQSDSPTHEEDPQGKPITVSVSVPIPIPIPIPVSDKPPTLELLQTNGHDIDHFDQVNHQFHSDPCSINLAGQSEEDPQGKPMTVSVSESVSEKLPQATTHDIHLFDQVKHQLHSDPYSVKLSNQSEEDPQVKPITVSVSEKPPKLELPQATSRDTDLFDQVKHQLPPVLPGFSILPETPPVKLEDTPPLPPLPPMQWRMRKLQSPLLTPTHVGQHSDNNFPPVFQPKVNEIKNPEIGNEKFENEGSLHAQDHDKKSASTEAKFVEILVPKEADEMQNNIRPMKIQRPRNPLIDAVATHDKNKLRKVLAMSQITKGQENDKLLEQIRTKSYNLKPPVQTRPNIQGPTTNVRIAAILEKANAIRQAFAGSDDDDDDSDSWSDS